jgi:hypothetical protein
MKVFVNIPNLFFRVKVDAVLKHLNIKKTDRDNADLFLLDLENSDKSLWKEGALGFASHTREDLFTSAKEMGVTALPKSAFFDGLPKLLEGVQNNQSH